MADEILQLPVTTDLACNGVLNHDLARPHRLQRVTVALVQRGEVLLHRIGLPGHLGLPADQRHRSGELRKPWHLRLPPP